MPLEIELYHDENDPPGFAELVEACYKEKPDRQKTHELRVMLENQPELYKRVYDMAQLVRADLIGKISTAKAARLGLASNVTSMKREMSYDQAPIIEQLLIDNIINSWLRYQWAEYQMAERIGGDGSIDMAMFWERRMTETQKRFLRAVETLAKVRKLKLPALQVNINTDNGQQVNVAGDLVRK